MKAIVEQGLQVSADIAGKAGTAIGTAAVEVGAKAAGWGEQAANKAHSLSERGALSLEIKALEYEIAKLGARLGVETYTCLVERALPSIDAWTPEISAILEKMAEARAKIEEKEAAFKAAEGR
jgi:hypothetical protein